MNLINFLFSIFKIKSSYDLELIIEAQKWVGTKEEGGDNSGKIIEMFQKAVNPKPNKESWCADFVIYCVQEIEKKHMIKSGLYRSELAQDLYNKSPVSMRISSPVPGCVVVWKRGNSGLGHAGIVEKLNSDGTMNTIEGNTGPGVGVVSNGDGVYRRTRTQIGTPIMSVLGFLKVF